MKIKGAKKVHYDSGPNMTPLVDVVMVILIFLMLAGSFGGAAHYMASSMPLAQGGVGGVTPPPGWVPEIPLDIRVDVGPTGLVARVGNSGHFSDAESLMNHLAGLKNSLPEHENKQVQLSPGRFVNYDTLVQVYDAAMRAGFKKIAFATSH